MNKALRVSLISLVSFLFLTVAQLRATVIFHNPDPTNYVTLTITHETKISYESVGMETTYNSQEQPESTTYFDDSMLASDNSETITVDVGPGQDFEIDDFYNSVSLGEFEYGSSADGLWGYEEDFVYYYDTYTLK